MLINSSIIIVVIQVGNDRGTHDLDVGWHYLAPSPFPFQYRGESAGLGGFHLAIDQIVGDVVRFIAFCDDIGAIHKGVNGGIFEENRACYRYVNRDGIPGGQGSGQVILAEFHADLVVLQIEDIDQELVGAVHGFGAAVANLHADAATQGKGLLVQRGIGHINHADRQIDIAHEDRHGGEIRISLTR